MNSFVKHVARLALCMVTALCGTTAGAAELTVAYTANTSGKLMACGCPGDPYGGLAERVTLVKQIRKNDRNLLLLDAGNMVSLFGDFDARAACVMRLMNLMGYQAAGVGRQELFNNTPGALAMSKNARFPFLSTSVAGKGGSKAPFRPYTIVKAGNTAIGIIGVCDSTCFFPELNRKFDYAVDPFENNLKPILDELAPRTDFIVVLSQMEPANSEKLLRMFPGVDLVIQGYGNSEMEKPRAAGRGFLVAPGDRGQFVGIVRLEKPAGGVSKVKRGELLPVLDIPQDKKAMDIIRDYYRKRK